MIAARTAAYVVGIVAALALITVESPTVASAILAGIVLATLLIIAWSHGVFAREPRPRRPVSPYMGTLRRLPPGEYARLRARLAEEERAERAQWAAASRFFDQDDYSDLDRRDGLGTRH